MMLVNRFTFRRWAACASSAFVLAASMGATRGAEANARRSAMGDVITVRDGGSQANVAFRAIPSLSGQPRIIPLPIGLAQVAFAPPHFDPDNPDFSVVEIANLVLEPPLDLRLTSPSTGDQAGIEIHVAKDEIVLDLGDGKSLMPDDPFRRGGRFATDLFSSGIGFIEVGLAPLITARTRIDFSEDLYRALREAAPLSSTGVYTLEPEGEAQAAMALGVNVAAQVAGLPFAGADPDLDDAGDAEAVDLPLGDGRGRLGDARGGWRVYAGAGFKPLFGLAYFDHRGTIEVIPAEPLLDPNEPTDVIVHSIIRTAMPGSPGSIGQGFALDLGIAALYGSAWELGLGVSDLAGSIRWRTQVQEVTLDQATQELVSRTIAENEGYRSRLTPQTTVNLARHWGRFTVATSAERGMAGTSGHLGVEHRLARLFAVRGGVELDGSGKLQGTGGGGVRFGPVGLDAALTTSSANLSEKRALLLGLSLALY